MKVKDVRKVAKMWERNNTNALKLSRGSKREFYRGFICACQAFQDLIDGKRDGALKSAEAA